MKVKSILILSALLIISNLGLVSATYAEVTAGAYFSTAPLVEPGIYDGVLGTNGSNGTAYYKFNALKGQTVNLSAVFTKTKAGPNGSTPGLTDACRCLVPSIRAYDSNMFNLGQTVGDGYNGPYASLSKLRTTAPFCIKYNDTSPNTYSGYYKVEKSGINYVAVSTAWGGTCEVSAPGLEGSSVVQSQMAAANKMEADKRLLGSYYDLNIVVEGIPDAGTVVAPVTTTSPSSTVSGNGQMSTCQFIDLLSLLGIVDSTKAASVKVTMGCK